MTGNGKRAGPEGLLGQPQQHDRVLAAREEQHRAVALGDDLPHDVNRLGLEHVEVSQVPDCFLRHAVAPIRPSSSIRVMTTARRLGGGCVCRLQAQLGRRRDLVRIRDAGEVLEAPVERLRVVALRIAPDALLERRRDVHLDERRLLRDHLACPPARVLVGRDRGDDHHGAGSRDSRGGRGDACDVRVTTLLVEAEIVREKGRE